MNEYSAEEVLVENPAIELFEELGYKRLNCFLEIRSPDSTLGRESRNDVALLPRMKETL
ncbi:MAG: hypothetical protein QQN63_10900 [Nitrosopumilus sp.]